MKLVHYSHKIVTEVKGRTQNPSKQRRYKVAGPGKPFGFWVSDEGRNSVKSWKRWCIEQNFSKWSLRYKHEVTLSPDAKILYLRSHEDIDAFGKKYADNNSPEQQAIDEVAAKHHFSGGRHIITIDWKRVAKKYHGIIITPYIWSQRLGDNYWYHGWDCASGVIWNARAIQSIEMVQEFKVPKKPTLAQMRRKRKLHMERMKAAIEGMQKFLESQGVEVPELPGKPNMQKVENV